MGIIDPQEYTPSFFGSADYITNTGTNAADTGIDLTVALASSLNSSNMTPSPFSGPYVINTGSFGVTSVSGTTNYDYRNSDWQNKRMDVRDNGKIPVDIWAMMYNNGVIDD